MPENLKQFELNMEKIISLLNKIIFPIVRAYWFILKSKTIGVKCVVRFQDKILLIRNNFGYRNWTFSGGGMKKNEAPENAAKREVLEETGLVLDLIKYYGELEVKKGRGINLIHCFFGETKDDRIKIEKLEILEAKWFQENELPELAPIAKEIFNKVKYK